VCFHGQSQENREGIDRINMLQKRKKK
jgi:hypothetical protein